MDLEQLKQLYMNNAASAQGMQKSFSDMLKERRGFVQGQEDQNFGAIKNSIQNGSNGVPINPVDAIGDFLNFSTANSNKTNELVNQGAVYGRQNTDALNALTSLLGMASDNSYKSQDLALKEKELGLQYGGANAESQVIKQGGANLLDQAKDPQTRRSLAATIINSGGVNQYKQSLPLDALLNDNERTGLKASTETLAKMDAALQAFKGSKDWFGTGILSQAIPDFLASSTTQDLRRKAADVRAGYMQTISGKVISDREAERLKQFLPDKDKSEQQNINDLNYLRDQLSRNMQLFEIGKREGLTANQAYDKYASKFGLDSSNNGKPKVGGYTIEKIE